MKLSEFIKESVTEILKGLKESESDKYKFGLHKDIGIEFDVAVIGKASTGAKVGVEIFSIGASTKGQISEEKVQRLKFRLYTKGKKLNVDEK